MQREVAIGLLNSYGFGGFEAQLDRAGLENLGSIDSLSTSKAFANSKAFSIISEHVELILQRRMNLLNESHYA